ncbi:antibiotic resistance protein VanZ [Stappia sp. F7233]|uniref:Antibiotic resistance protein VanZ n=1 Tax=Stappia albiluteola TaxID=2758565 RepID=A0A839AJJ2_9HYPH|nr:antibiotic resistance protein VanZ [Stappia albiluteola]MBA5778927.1 antibiotic resistance protein VanZ [Stappia albiluteola]
MKREAGRKMMTGNFDRPLIRLLPFLSLAIYGAAFGLVFNSGLAHPYDKLQHIAFYGLLTLSIHSLLRCRLRLSAALAFAIGVAGEALQALTPHHQASVLDIAANSLGVLVVAAMIALMRSEEEMAIEGDGADLIELPAAAQLSAVPSSSSASSSAR